MFINLCYVILTFNVCHSPDVIFSGQNKFVINNPLWFMIQTCGRVKLNILVILDGKIVTGSFQVCHLNKSKQ